MNLNDLLQELVRHDGTDLYVTVGAPPKVSVDGVFRSIGDTPCTAEDLESLIQAVVPDASAFDAHPEADVAIQLGGERRFRINAFKQRGHYALVARRIHTTVPNLGALHLPEAVSGMVLSKKGLVLVTGPTGSGKSTTLAAMIDCRNTQEDGHIIMIEDPIEYLHTHKKSIVSQREIGLDTPSYHHALRSALRQAPHVLSIGEIRDKETAEAALGFAETGHLVLATLHSVNAAQTLERLLGLFPPAVHAQIQLLLSLNLLGILSQRLLPARGGGRVLATELLLSSARTRDLIKRGDVTVLGEAIAQGTERGMMTFDQSLYRLVQEAKIESDDALAWADCPNDLRILLSKDDAVAEAGIRFAR